jgi:hypothetical protein
MFCVAASRGKEQIIFINNGEKLLTERTLAQKPTGGALVDKVNISEMFDFKYKEDVEDCYKLLRVKPVNCTKVDDICVKNRDGMIDLSPCVDVYQEAVFFKKYDLEKRLELYFAVHPQGKNLVAEREQDVSLDRQILQLISLETHQLRYRTQVNVPFVKRGEREALIKRLQTVFDGNEDVQVQSDIQFFDGKSGRAIFTAVGLADVVKGDAVYELKFVSEVMHEHFLQCACYAVALGLPRGILWNTRSNSMYEITVPDVDKFLDAVVKAVTKGRISDYLK